MLKSRRKGWGGACSMYRGEKRLIQSFSKENGGKETTWKTRA
jgi:hypothetical protein